MLWCLRSVHEHEQPENRSKIFQPNCISYVNIHTYKQSVYTDQRDENDEVEKKKKKEKEKREGKNETKNLGEKKSIFLKTCTSITWHFYSSRCNKQFWHCSIYRTIYVLNGCVSVGSHRRIRTLINSHIPVVLLAKRYESAQNAIRLQIPFTPKKLNIRKNKHVVWLSKPKLDHAFRFNLKFNESPILKIITCFEQQENNSLFE